MNMEKLTQKSRQALASAQQLAAQRHHQEISGKHLMAVLIKQEDGITPACWNRLASVLPPWNRN